MESDPVVQDASLAEAFVDRWQGVTASELATSQTFLLELCGVLGVPRPHPTSAQDYMFERPVTFAHGDGTTSAGRIDLYRRGAFVLESKKLKVGVHTKGFDDALLRARSQAEAYARALPVDEGRPPFVVVVDVGNRIELYAEFSQSGATYTPFPDPANHRIALDDLRRPEVREQLRRVWTDPFSLDPSRASAKVTREIADQLAKLARSLEQAGHRPEAVAQFMVRCLFTCFAEDVRLLPADSFCDLLIRHAKAPETAMKMVSALWQEMDHGGFSTVIVGNVLQFNGKLFKQPDTLPLDVSQLGLLILAAKADWKHVEPAIFGTLLERALSPSERHRLGAHYTPRSYVERLVLPTVIEPLRQEWSLAHAAALTLASEGKTDDAVKVMQDFHHRLCTVRVLDPACGSGNFLYVTLEHLKRLEGEVFNALDEIGYRQTGLALGGERADAAAGETVDPHNLLGIELNPRAAAIAEVVLWIGYLQWHFRTRGDVHPPQPVVRNFRNIESRDAVLAFDTVEPELDEHGEPRVRWDGVTMKTSPVTGDEIPDDSATVAQQRYVQPRHAAWPDADFVVGNPPFIGASTMRRSLGDGYTQALREAWPEVPESADFVMYWWHHAAMLTRQGALERFGFITTNSIRQTFNRRVIEAAIGDAKHPLSLAFAIPDHPWVDSVDGAAVRIAMTVAQAGVGNGLLRQVDTEVDGNQGEVSVTLRNRAGLIHADLRVGPNLVSATALRANSGLSSPGLKLHGAGFIVTVAQAEKLGLDEIDGLETYIRPYRNGHDLTDKPRGVLVIDLFGLDAEDVRRRYPDVYQHVVDYVKPARDQNSRPVYRMRWWIHGEPRQELRKSLLGLSRYIATVETAKHRTFQFLDGSIAPDNKLIVIALDDAYHLAVLSSAIHMSWAIASGGRLGVGNDPVYVKSRCFEPFPFPLCADDKKHHLRSLAEQLDAHRKHQQTKYPDLTLTGMYNVLDKLRAGVVLSAKERTIHEHGVLTVLRQLHDDIDAAVLDAYGWSDLLALLRVAHGNDAPVDGSTRQEAARAFDEASLDRLVKLNAERASEELRGLVHWLRPEYQRPSVATDEPQAGMALSREDGAIATAGTPKPLPWPKDYVEQVRAIAQLLSASLSPLSIDDIGARFTARGPWKRRLPKLVDMLVALGRAQSSDGKFRVVQ